MDYRPGEVDIGEVAEVSWLAVRDTERGEEARVSSQTSTCSQDKNNSLQEREEVIR